MAVILRSQQHASRLFVDDGFRLFPKSKFLFHVAFGINKAAIVNNSLLSRHKNEIGMMVKSVSLPSFKVSVDTLNQYNRKKNIQYTHKFEPVEIIFHDDNMSLINHLWQNYYTYYYADPLAAKNAGAYTRNAMLKFSYTTSAYGLDNGSMIPFFKYIRVYQMALHEYVSYTLYNPLVTSWNHNKMDYFNNTLNDNNMSFLYESVEYGSGKIEDGSVDGFAIEHYDNTPSPNQEAAKQAEATGKVNMNFEELPETSEAKINKRNANEYYQNLKQPMSGLATTLPTAMPTIGGLNGLAFPLQVDTEEVVVAKLIGLR